MWLLYPILFHYGYGGVTADRRHPGQDHWRGARCRTAAEAEGPDKTLDGWFDHKEWWKNGGLPSGK